MEASKLVHKISKFINYANLCKFTEPRKGPGVQSAINFYIFFFFFFFFFFFSLYFFFLCPFRASNFYFLTSRKLYHMKFAIFDVARCRMSATSLTLWLIVLQLKKGQFIYNKCKILSYLIFKKWGNICTGHPPTQKSGGIHPPGIYARRLPCKLCCYVHTIELHTSVLVITRSLQFL